MPAIEREHALSGPQLRESLPLLESDRRRKGLDELAYVRRLDVSADAVRMFAESWIAEAGSREAAFLSIGIDGEVVAALRERLVRRSEGKQLVGRG
jgi:hypothetical protein